MSGLTGFAVNGALRMKSGGVIASYRNGVPVDATGAICFSNSGPARWSNGLPFTTSGLLAAQAPGTPDHWSNGLPFTPTGRLALGDGIATVSHWNQGVPHVGSGRLCVVLT